MEYAQEVAVIAHIADRWHRKDAETGKKIRTDRYGKGLRWQVEHVDGNGAKRRKSFETRDLADRYLTDLKAELHRGVYRRGTGRETLAEVAQHWLDTQLHLRPASRDAVDRRLRTTILPALGHRRLAEITTADVQTAVGTWSATLAPVTVRNTYATLSAVMAWAVHNELIPRTPCVKVRLPAPEHAPLVPLTTEQVQHIAEVIRPELSRAVLFAAATGLRGGELRGLTWDRVHEGHVVVDRQIVAESPRDGVVFAPLKTRASVRSVSIGPATRALLSRQRLEYGEGPAGLVFHTGRGPWTRKAMGDAWRAARAQLPGIGSGWHQLRHHAASLLVSAGMSPTAVAHRLGHRDATETLKTYANLWPSDDERMAAAGDAVATLPSPTEVVPIRAVPG